MPAYNLRSRVLEAVRNTGPKGLTLAECMATLGVCERTARIHLLALLRDNRIEADEVRSGRVGMPAKIYYVRSER